MDQPSNTIALEVCVDSLPSGLIAASRGAARLEINSALTLGGLSCSIGFCQEAVRQIQPLGCAIIAMVRPRPGGFVYEAEELAVIQRDIDALLQVGVDGVALGVLMPTGEIDVEAVGKLIEPVLAQGRQAVFHRAFDLTPNAGDALESLVGLGFTRVLTSGQAPTAMQGAATIRDLIEQADGRIEVLPGSGITPSNAEHLVRETGCDQVHASLRRVVEDESCAAQPKIQFNSDPPAGGGYHQAAPDKIAAMMATLDRLQNRHAH